MSCLLKLIGKSFDVYSFIEYTKLVPYKVYKIGDKINRKGDLFDKNGCCFDVSIASFKEFEIQLLDAINFLKNNFEKLKLLPNYNLTSSDMPCLDFAICTKMFDEDVAVQCNYFKTELLFLTGNLGFGIELSQYSCEQ